MAPYEKAAESAFSIIDQLVDDGDLAVKLKHEMQINLLTTKTDGFVDGSIKVLFAIRDLILPILRPVGAFYLTYMGVDMATAELAAGGDMSALSGGLATAFPTWMGARELNKGREQRIKQDRVLRGDPDFDD